MRGAIRGPGDLRGLSETRKGEHRETAVKRQRGAARVISLRCAKSARLVNHVDGFLGGLVEGSYRFRVCLEGALGDDERRKLGRDIHIGGL
jgi:hypothetical protein